MLERKQILKATRPGGYEGRRLKTMTENNLLMYHNQASKDPFAMIPDDLGDRIISTTMKLIKEAYREYLEDLMLEAQEAY